MTPRSGLRCCGLTRIRGPLAGRRELEADTSASQTADAHLRDRWLGDPAVGGHAWRQRGDQLSRTRATLACVPVRAENRIHGSDQQSCSPGAPPAMITGHVPAVPVPPDHSASRVAAAVPARGSVADRRDLDPAPPARRPAAAAAAPPGRELGGPGPARDPARRDTQSGEPVPDLVKVVLQIGLELRYRHPVHAGRALIRLDLLPRLPDSPLRDAKRLARCFQLVHATPPPGSPGVDRTDTVRNDPAPFAPPSLQGHQRYYEPVRQRAPRRYSAPCGSAAWVTPCRTAP